jgi:small subunit ribosomal protein S18
MSEERTQSSSVRTPEDGKKVFFKRRRGCPLSVSGAPEITYKDPDALSRFVSEGGRILPSRVTNVCAGKQRKLNNQIKIARLLALMPFVSSGK